MNLVKDVEMVFLFLEKKRIDVIIVKIIIFDMDVFSFIDKVKEYFEEFIRKIFIIVVSGNFLLEF